MPLTGDWLTLGAAFTYNRKIHALKKAASGVVTTLLQVSA
jgi:hypothetical protein